MHPSQLPPATVVGYWLTVSGVAIFHVGLVSDRRSYFGLPHVISASKRTGYVVEEPWEEFAQGATVEVCDIRGNLSAQDVLGRARQKIGHEWRLVVANCEHFVRWAHGLPVTSPQLQAGVVKAGLGLAVAAIAAKVLTDVLAEPTPRRRR